MKKILLLLILPFCAVSQADIEYANTIKIEDLKKHLKIIASDSLEGRETGSAGQFKAAEYISNQFQKLGLKPIVKGSDGKLGYYQYFNLYKKGWTKAYVKVGDKKKIFFKDFYPVGLVNIPDEVSEEVVFAGYGIHESQYSDYQNIDVKGKSVAFFSSSPKSLLKLFGQETDFTEKQKTDWAFSNGANTVFIISDADENEFKSNAAERKAVLGRYNKMMLEKTGENQVSEKPSFVISSQMAADIFNTKVKKINKAAHYYDSSNKTPSGLFPSKKIEIVTKRGEEQIQTMNVMGFLEGKTKPNEVLVVSAHYDHVGIDDKGNIYNGADDDGSGSCAVLEIAEAFALAAKNGYQPDRSILFLTVSGEEKGLLGSKFFTDIEPIIPLNQIIADLNIDMIGRIDKKHEPNEEYVYLIGADKLSSELQYVADSINKHYLKFELDYTYNDSKDPNRFYYRSDHYNFAKNKIPVIFYFTGVHEDYHQPGDDEYKILYSKYQKIVQYIFMTSWELANRDQKIKVDSNKP